MLIATYFKRPNAPVSLPNKDGSMRDYFFRPVDPATPDSEHVADVSIPEHIQRFMQIPEGYYVAEANAAFDAAKVLAAQAQRPVVAPGVDAVEAKRTVDVVAPLPDVQHDITTPVVEAATVDVDASAKALLELPLAKLKAELKTAPRAVLATALALESDKGNDERATVIKHLKAALA